MSLQEIADKLVKACREGGEAELLNTCYQPDVVSVEAADMGNGRESVGLDALRGKHAWWAENMVVTKGQVSDPMLHGSDRFAVIFEVTGHEKASGEAFDMKEVGVYHVRDDKIAREEFFYAVGG